MASCLAFIRMIGASTAVVVLFAGSSAAAAQTRAAPGTICPDPGHPCPDFRPHDLSFVLPTDTVARAEDRSAPFYAILLQSGPKCSISERSRVTVQALFPDRKVFSNRFECNDDAENNVHYVGADARFAFLAVYAGDSLPEGNALLASVVAAGKFKGANLRQLRVVRVRP
jgi:hypothetical protein